MKKLPLVSVVMITYGHELFIEEAINGVLMQECNFDIELILANDVSPDSTDCIIQNILEFHHRASIIHYIKHEKNIGMMPNFVFALQQSKSKYIALCDADDYWTDPLKLRKQVDFLENNPDYNICFHEVSIFNQNKNEIENNTLTRNVPGETDVNELAKGNYIHTPSVVLRNNFILPNWFLKSTIGDWSLYMIVVKDKKIKKLNDVMAVYRLHNESNWSLKSNEYRALNTIINFKLFLNSNKLEPKTKKILNASIEDLEKLLPSNLNFLDEILNKTKKVFILFRNSIQAVIK